LWGNQLTAKIISNKQVGAMIKRALVDKRKPKNKANEPLIMPQTEPVVSHEKLNSKPNCKAVKTILIIT